MSEHSRTTAWRMILLAVTFLGLLPARPGSAAHPHHAPAATLVLAQATAAEPPPRTEEEKKRIKSAVLLLSVLSGIALSGLLLIIGAVAIRGLQRKLAGPTRLDREPADLLVAAQPAPSVGPPPTDLGSPGTELEFAL